MNVHARHEDRTDPESTRLRVGLFGRLGSGNIGNDASLEAMLAYLTRELPDAELDCMCSGAVEVTRRYGLPSTPLHWVHSESRVRSRWVRAGLTASRVALGALIDTWRTASWVRRHNVVIVPGMGVLEATLPQRPWQLPYSLFLLSCFGRVFGTKVAFVCVGATVIRERLTGRLLTAAGKLAHYRSFRDKYSLDAARAMGYAGDHDKVYPDLVFALSSPHGRPGASISIGVGVMAYFGRSADRFRADHIHAEYVGQMKQFVRWLVEAGHRVRLLIGDAADEPVAETIVADARMYCMRPDPLPVVYDPVSSTSDVMRQLAPLDAVVATRFHNVLVALTCAKPTVAISYGSKHDALMTRMGVGEFVQDIGSLDVDRLKQKFTDLETQKEHVARTLYEQSRRNRALLERQFAELTSVLFAPSGRRARSWVR